jgi:phenylpropionate dioxygenase-like ring-hydroxylating dioxygenase large terminal subunit
MGNYLRQYWIPSTVPSTLLPAPDCPPLRVRLLGEDLIAFRTTSGKVGLVANACPHRGASLFFGRNEEDGLRCVYHGWKFEVDGSCVDMPSEPAESNFKSKVKVRAYPTIERNGMIWAYMGTRETPPPLPEFEYNTASEEMCVHPRFVFYDCNWMQSMEGDIDSSHIDYLHSRLTPEQAPNDFGGGGRGFYGFSDPRYEAPILSAYPMDYGLVYTGRRKWDDEGNYWYRITQFCLPFYTMVASGGPTVSFNAWIPLDDDHTVQISFTTSLRQPVSAEARAPADPYTRMGGYLPSSSDPLSRWRSPANAGNDYLIDYELQRTVRFSGIPREGKLQDMAVMESMGYIYDRTKEHLGRLDTMIIAVRRALLAAAKAHSGHGEVHATVEQPELYRVRPVEIMLKDGTDWFEATEDHRRSDARVRLADFITAQPI